MNRKVYIGAGIIALVVALGIGSAGAGEYGNPRLQAAGVMAPTFEVDPMWPKPLPNHWVIGMTIGVSADAQDNIWIIHRGGSLEPKETYGNTNPPGADCCMTAPPVLEFDKAGNLIGHWGGPGKGYNWPNSNHGITVDYKGNVWIGGNGRTVDPKLQDSGATTGPEASQPGAFADNQILKFTQDGKFLMQIGHPFQSKGSNDVENLKGPAKLFVDAKTNELYVADGYGNKRVIVFDADTGKYKRHWGAYGHKPGLTRTMGNYNPDAPIDQQFRSPVHCTAQLSRTTVCWRFAAISEIDRIQVFKRTAPSSRSSSSKEGRWVTARSGTLPSPRILNRNISLSLRRCQREDTHHCCRDTLEELTSFGDSRRTAARSVLRCPQHRDGFQGATYLYDGNVPRTASSEIRLARAGTCREKRPGRGVAEKVAEEE